MSDPTGPYTADKPRLSESSEELRARIPGWGSDLDPANRPSFPREQFDPGLNGAHWTFPERQPEPWPRERSVEHTTLPPVFGTSCPPKGLSGAIRKLAYARYSEGRAAHWLLLVLGDRVDVLESMATSALRLRPDNPVREWGILSEFSHGGVRSRFGTGRADLPHQALDPVVNATPWVIGAVGLWRAGRAVSRGVRRVSRGPATAS
jgi:hypothetical protein